MSEFTTRKFVEFVKTIVDEGESTYAYGSQTSLYGEIIDKLYKLEEAFDNDTMTTEEIDEEFEWIEDYYKYLGEQKQAVEDGIITSDDIAELWDNDADSYMARVRDLIKERGAI